MHAIIIIIITTIRHVDQQYSTTMIPHPSVGPTKDEHWFVSH
jgi:hypothetical protein